MRRVEEYFGGIEDICEKLNEVIRAINQLNGGEEEQKINEMLRPNDILVLSKNEEGLLTAVNDGNGRLLLERVVYPKEEETQK